MTQAWLVDCLIGCDDCRYSQKVLPKEPSTLYAVLGVRQDASKKEIKAAYIRLSKEVGYS